MIRLGLDHIADITRGQLERSASGSPTTIAGVSTDSRAVRPGQAFVALIGERFDGHAFCATAARAGAALLIVQRPVDDLPADVPRPAVLQVDDTVRALGALAHAWRLHVAPTVVAITGSVGKTTTKELTAQILRLVGPTHHNPGNLNNHIGLPLTLLAMPEATRFVVLELGMSALGEIDYLAHIARANVGLITAIAPVHLQQLGSLEAIASAKAELLHSLEPSATAIIPDAEPLMAPHLARITAQRVLRFGYAADSEVRLLEVLPRGVNGLTLTLSLRGHETITVDLPLVGQHNASNAAAALAVGLALELPVDVMLDGLRQLPELGHRSALRRLGGVTVLDDCYNASPSATKAALDTLRQLASPGPAVAVLGEMRELGEQAAALHRAVGRHAASLQLKALITVGAMAKNFAEGAREAGMATSALHGVDTTEEAAEAALAAAGSEGWILLKGSRGAKMERVLEALEALSAGIARS